MSITYICPFLKGDYVYDGHITDKNPKFRNSYYYVKLSYKDSRSKEWKTKTLGTKLEVKNNKRKADAMVDKFVEQYSYLEELPCNGNELLDPNITLCEYLDLWLIDKERDLKVSTYEAYSYRVNCIKKYFETKDPKVIEVTPKMMDTFFKYSLKYGKINQKTHEKESLAVRSVRSYKSILYAAFSQASIDGLIKSNPVIGVSVHGKKNREYSEELLFLTEEEISELLVFMAENYPRLLGITFIGAYYGLRRSEILGLKWSAINYRKKTISINHTIVRVKTTNPTDSTKTQSSKRELNLFDTAEKCLQKIAEEQANNKDFYKKEYKNKEGYILTGND